VRAAQVRRRLPCDAEGRGQRARDAPGLPWANPNPNPNSNPNPNPNLDPTLTLTLTLTPTLTLTLTLTLMQTRSTAGCDLPPQTTRRPRRTSAGTSASSSSRATAARCTGPAHMYPLRPSATTWSCCSPEISRDVAEMRGRTEEELPFGEGVARIAPCMEHCAARAAARRRASPPLPGHDAAASKPVPLGLGACRSTWGGDTRGAAALRAAR
jgi:hypothetical protein